MNYNLNNRSLPSPTFASTSAAYNCVGRGVYLSADDFADAAASCGRQGDVSGGEAVLVIWSGYWKRKGRILSLS